MQMQTVPKLTVLALIGILAVASWSWAESGDEADATVHNAQSNIDDSASKWRVDIDNLDTLPWKHVIERLTVAEPLKSGRGKYTLLRVVLEGQEPDDDQLADDMRTVNGVPVRTTGRPSYGEAIEQGSARESRTNPFASISVGGTKVLTLDAFPSGGGALARLHSGDFIVVEHINSATRRGGKDPLRVHSVTHGYADLWIPVPAMGELGVFGEVVLPRIDPTMMGRLIAEVTVTGQGPSRSENLVVRFTTGGYGESFFVNEHNMATTRLLAPGNYSVHIATGEISRNQVPNTTIARVLPGRVTYLTYTDSGKGSVELVSSTTFNPSAIGPSVSE
jgi:hypothetical protein